ncbi:hypothetical protein EUTSA_v10021925mg [Eutrema salsugineum]|uniref:F-box domain-containing protein n=1 Tax=Eutrema salsugineum TaxID=72664 RepID=V4M0N8_EUTSA|nr:F-box/kelch-repeat protein At4g33290 [Eutrema salsugineum]ESQ49659.1 hypothetical protein EUTSA_v10021925mg [Eutrema salsugineum]
MILDLPRDLVEEIFYRLPLKSMRAVRLTCREWDTLSKSRSFTKMRIDKEASAAREGESRMIIMMNENLHLMSLFLEGDPSTENKSKLSCLNENEQIKIAQVFYCEGLLLCILKDDSRLVVWNPYLGQTRWIEPRYFHQGHGGRDMERYRYALGYVNKKKKKKSYKILRFLDDQIENIYAPGERFKWYEMYDFDSDLWTTLDVPPHWFVTCSQRGISLKGNTYFCAIKKNSEDEFHLICFDFASERFGPLLPFPFTAEDDDYVTLSCVREEKLAVLLTHNESNPYELEIWITTKIESENVLWSKFLTLYTEPFYPISPWGFFIDEKKKVAMGFDEDFYHHTLSIVGEAKYLRKSVLGNKISRMWPHVCSYVPSPVQIKQPVKRKRQSNLEKRRYDEKMLTLAALENPVNELSPRGKRRK